MSYSLLLSKDLLLVRGPPAIYTVEPFFLFFCFLFISQIFFCLFLWVEIAYASGYTLYEADRDPTVLVSFFFNIRVGDGDASASCTQ